MNYAQRGPAERSADPPYLKSGSRTLWVRLRRGRPSRPALRRLWYPMPQRSQRFRRKDSHHDQDRPSILSADFAHLGRDIQRISDADYVHVDVMDGLFVPNISIGIPVVKCIRPVTDLPLDVHLMIDRPVRYVEQFCDAGGDLITCHVEADTEENIHPLSSKFTPRARRPVWW